MTKTAGKTTVANCGPATATLKYKGKTYTFKNGYCETSKAAGGALMLDLGTLVLDAKGNAGKSYFSLGVTKVGKRLNNGVITEADQSGKEILSEVIVKPKGTVAGATFTQYGTVPVSGSWNCHGVVYKGP